MGSEWPTVRFGEIYAESSRNGVTSPKSGRGSGIPMVGMGDVFANGRLSEGAYELVPLPESDCAKFTLQRGDLLFARRSLTLAGAGQCSMVTGSFKATFESSIIRCRLDTSVAVPEFYYYLFRSPAGRAVMETIVEQTAVAGIRSSDLARLGVPLPPLDEQRAIASILGALDDKIELNRRMSRTLDEMAQAIFKSWFVDSDDELPEGRLGDVVDVVRVSIQPQDVEPSTPYIGLEHFDGGSTTLRRWGFAPDASSGKSAFQRGDILFGKLRPYFHKVAVAPFAGVCSTDVMVLRSKAPEMFGFALGHINSDEFIDFTMARSEGTRMPRAKRSDVVGYPIQMPPHSRLVALGQVVLPVLERQRTLTLQARDLEQLRDALLPRLLSGEVRIHGPETITKEAT